MTVGEPPDPRTAADPAQFVDLLRQLRTWAGLPSLRRLRDLAGTAVDARGGEIDALPVSTTSYVLRGDRLPKMAFVRAFVTACLRARRRPEDAPAAYLDCWHDSWLMLRSGKTAGPGRSPDPVPVPRQLPADVAEFTGRVDELAQLGKLLGSPDPAGPVVILAIDGVGGVGKSALAIHAAHRLADRFPDGQLYVDLHGATAGLTPLDPLEVLGRFLRALGMPGDGVPHQLDEAAARFRTEVAGRRLLLVLDNAADMEQVRPLLPGTAGSGVLVTSRRTLPVLGGPGQVSLGLLSEPEAVALLEQLVGAERAVAEPRAAAEVAARCGWLPLALRIAAARLVARPGWPVAQLAERLADARHRLDELELAEVGVRASLTVSSDALAHSDDPLDRAAAKAYGPLAVWDGPELTRPVAARLLDVPEPEAERVLERLVDSRLLESPAPGRYRWHDLLRLHAREQATARGTEVKRTGALERLLRFYVATTWRCHALLRPETYQLARVEDHWLAGGMDFADDATALAWLETERANLLAAVTQAAASELAAAATQLARALSWFLLLRHHLHDLAQVNQAALAGAERTSDRVAKASVLNNLGVANERLGRYEDALDCYRRSLATSRELDDHFGMAASLHNLGSSYQRLGRYDEARACLQQSLAIDRTVGDKAGAAYSLQNLGVIYLRLDRCDEARDHVQRALDITREVGDVIGEASSLNDLGAIYLRLGRHHEARECVQQSLTVNRKAGYRWREAENLHTLGTIHHAEQRYAEALDCYRHSLAICRELAHRGDQAKVLQHLGVTLQALGRAGGARECWREALAIYEDLQLPAADEVRGLIAGR